MNQNAYSEKRRFVRLHPKKTMHAKVKRKGMLSLVSSATEVKLLDISEAGVGVLASKGNWELRQQVTFSMSLDTELEPVNGEIIWQTATTSGWKLGIKFLGDNADLRRFLLLHRQQFDA